MISVDDIRIAAFRFSTPGYYEFGATMIVKKTKSGHFFFNFYREGKKVFKKYQRVSGAKLVFFLRISFAELNRKLFVSTASVELSKARRAL